MKALIAAIAVATLGTASAAHAQQEDQWIYRDGGSGGPVAAFLSWNYRSVLIRAVCEDDVLLVEYFPVGEARADPPMALWLDDGALELRTTVNTDGQGAAVQGRLDVTPQLISAMSRAGHLMLEVSEPGADLDEPWHLGGAQPLQRLARHCIGF